MVFLITLDSRLLKFVIFSSLHNYYFIYHILLGSGAMDISKHFRVSVKHKFIVCGTD